MNDISFRRNVSLSGDWRGRIGLLWPHDGHTDDEFWAYLPAGVTLLVARFKAGEDQGELDVDALSAYAAPGPLIKASELLRLAKPDAVVSADHAGSFVGGVEAEIAQRRAVQGSLSVPFTTVSCAAIAAFRTLGVQRLALVAPYPKEVTNNLEAFLAGYGLTVTTSCCLDLESEAEIGTLPAERWHRISKEADHPDADAVFLAGGGIRTAGVLGVIEADLGKPVISAPAALIWHALQLMRVTPHAPEHGRLYTTFAAAHADGRLAEPTP